VPPALGVRDREIIRFERIFDEEIRRNIELRGRGGGEGGRDRLMMTFEFGGGVVIRRVPGDRYRLGP
jgi:hypothetical protein